jgi:multidrug efflux pump subunit AcrA (membrane-fusion protein)
MRPAGLAFASPVRSASTVRPGYSIILAAVLAVLWTDGPAGIRAQAQTPAAAPAGAPKPASAGAPTLRLHGLVEAVHFYSVMTPRVTGSGPGMNRLTIVRLAPKGALVKKGDLLVEFDRQLQVRAALDKRAEWLDLDEQIKKKEAEQRSQRAQDETSLKSAENAASLARLEMTKNPLLPRIEAEKNTLNLEAAEARLAQLKTTVALKQKAAEADLQILQVRRDRAENAKLHAERNSEKMLIRSPIDGLVVLKSIWKSGQMGEPQEGEELWPGSAILDVVGPTSMRVRVKVNQADLGMMRVGANAKVTLDAYPGKSYPARLRQVSPIGVAGQFSPKVRTFMALFDIDGSDSQLAPDLSAAVDVEVTHGTQ